MNSPKMHEDALPLFIEDIGIHVQTSHLLGEGIINKSPLKNTMTYPFRFRVYDAYGRLYAIGTFQSLRQMGRIRSLFKSQVERSDLVLRVYDRKTQTLCGIYPYGNEEPFCLNPRPKVYQGRKLLSRIRKWIER